MEIIYSKLVPLKGLPEVAERVSLSKLKFKLEKLWNKVSQKYYIKENDYIGYKEFQLKPHNFR